MNPCFLLHESWFSLNWTIPKNTQPPILTLHPRCSLLQLAILASEDWTLWVIFGFFLNFPFPHSINHPVLSVLSSLCLRTCLILLPLLQSQPSSHWFSLLHGSAHSTLHLLVKLIIICPFKHPLPCSRIYKAAFFKKIIYLIYLFLTALGLRCCVQAFSSCTEWGLLFIAVRGLLIAVASLVAEHGL